MTDEGYERLTATLLAAGVAVSSILVATGFIASFLVGWTGSLTGATPLPADPTDFSAILDRLAVLQPLAIVQLGLIVLIATPIIRVATTAVSFWRQHDRLYVAISLIVIALLFGSFLLLR